MKVRTMTICSLMVLAMLFTYSAQAQVCPYVPYFSQLDSRWAKNMLGTCQGETIGKSGCAITSVSMIFKYHERNLDIDPGKLNEWLKKNCGYVSGCQIIWAASVRYAKNIVLEADVWTTKLSAMDPYLNRLLPVIAKVLFNGLPHYVVVTYKYNGIYYINDPNGSGKDLRFYNNSISRFIVYSPPYCRAAPSKSGSEKLSTTWGAMKG